MLLIIKMKIDELGKYNYLIILPHKNKLKIC